MALTTIDTYGIKDGAVQIDDIGTLAGNLTINDSGKLRLGTGLDLQLYHDASGGDSYINDVGVGSLILTTTSNSTVAIKSSAEYMAKFSTNAGVELYYDNAKTFETISGGVTVTGQLYVTAELNLINGSSNAAKYIDCGLGDNNALTIRGTSGGDVNHETLAKFIRNGACELYHDTAKKLETTATGVKLDSWISLQSTGGIRSDSAVVIEDLGGNEWRAKFHDNAHVELAYDNSKKFETTSAGATVTGTLTTSGTGGGAAALGSHLDLGDNQKIRLGASDDLQIFHDAGGHSYIDEIANGNLVLRTNQSGTWSAIVLQAGSENSVIAYKNGGVELYYDAGKKFETNSAGVEVTGRAHIGHTTAPTPTAGSLTGGLFLTNTDNAYGMQFGVKSSGMGWIQQTRVDGTATNYDLQLQPAGGHVWMPDNSHLMFGAGNDLKIYSDGAAGRIDHLTTGSGADLILRSKSFVVRNLSDENMIIANENGAVNLYYNNSRKLHTRNNGINVIGDLDMTDADGYKLNLGVSSDLQIYHDGNHSYVEDTGTGELRLASNSGVRITKGDSETQALFTVDGASELYYNNSKKWETVSDGQKTFGHYYADDGNKIQLGTSQDLQLWHDGTDSIIRNLTGETRIQCANIFEVTNYGNTETYIKGSLNGAVELYYDNSKKFQTRTGGAYVYGKGGGTTFAASQAMHAVDRCGFEVQGELTGIKIASTYNDNTHPEYGLVFVQGPSTSSYNCWSISPDGPSKGNGLNFHYGAQSGNIHVNTNCKVTLSGAGHFFPYTNNASDLGTSSKRWRNLYINDLQLSNEGNSNSVDGTWGDWTLQEGEEDIFMINNRSGKKYRMALQEVS